MMNSSSSAATHSLLFFNTLSSFSARRRSSSPRRFHSSSTRSPPLPLSVSASFHHSPTYFVSSAGFVSRGNSRKTGSWSLYTMSRSSTKTSAFRDRDGDSDEGGGPAVFEQEALLGGLSSFRNRYVAEGLEATLNRLSKWIVSAIFGAIVLCRHDLVAVWFAGGSVINSFISIILKRILNQERPVSNMRSDPGMPSSHAQSIFFVSTFAIISLLELGINGFTILTSGITLAIGSYLTWLRVSQQLHTVSQIAVGAVLGTIFCFAWYCLWHGIVMEAFESLLWVRVLVFTGAAALCLSFAAYVLKEWLRDE